MESLNQELYLVFHDDQSKSTIGSPQSSDVGGCHVIDAFILEELPPDAGIEPATSWLTARRSTTELIGHFEERERLREMYYLRIHI